MRSTGSTGSSASTITSLSSSNLTLTGRRSCEPARVATPRRAMENRRTDQALRDMVVSLIDQEMSATIPFERQCLFILRRTRRPLQTYQSAATEVVRLRRAACALFTVFSWRRNRWGGFGACGARLLAITLRDLLLQRED